MNVGILLLGLIGGAVVAVGLELQERRHADRWRALATDGVRANGTVSDVTSTGRFAALRRVTVAVDGGGVFIQTLDVPETHRLGIVVGQRVALRHRPGDPSDAMLDLGEPTARRWPVPLVAGAVIAALGVAASLVV